MAVIHLGFRAPAIKEQSTPSDIGIEYEQVQIPTHAGKQLFSWLLTQKASDETLTSCMDGVRI
jgi:hypothetical protein